MDQLHLNVRNTASSVALDKQGRERDLGRGFRSKKLQSRPKCRKIRKLRILQCNINGLCTPSSRVKLDKILELASKHQVSIIALQETKLNTRHRLRVKGYNIVRQDRSSNGGGGLMFLIRDVYFQRIDRINSPRKSLESQGITVLSRKHNNNINIFNLYHPPNNQKLDLDALEGLFTKATVLLGDLNAKHTAWGCALENNRGQDLENLSNDKAFLFLNNGTHTYRSHIVDYVGSDHYPILIELDYDIKTYGNKNIYWNFKKANWTLFEKNLNEQLQKNPITENLENEWFVFKHSIFTAAEGAVPRGKHKKTRPAFTNDSQDLQKLLAKREHLLQSHNLNDNTDARIELNKINAEIKREYCSIKQSNWQDLCKSLDYKTPNIRLWRLAKKLEKIQPQVENTNSITGTNGTSTVNDKETADALGNYYSEESKLALGRENKKTGRATRKLIRSCRVPASNELFNIPITSSELLYAIQQLDFKKSPGPDGIHGQFITEREFFVLKESSRKKVATELLDGAYVTTSTSCFYLLRKEEILRSWKKKRTAR
ncbi:putative RNA-directed DNA polymerase from transposon BS [Caerostris darwini]|uniref:RNA-directed DNA polymerase from transposon BS n=1 Tax=Caerostris darwini TaxID=1538125 RepID=A0AAV4SGX4_9ARAC|nr:putative RNA-directed DNA polymerase from transposon BS [Caerostris darwini]